MADTKEELFGVLIEVDSDLNPRDPVATKAVQTALTELVGGGIGPVHGAVKVVPTSVALGKDIGVLLLEQEALGVLKSAMRFFIENPDEWGDADEPIVGEMLSDIGDKISRFHLDRNGLEVSDAEICLWLASENNRNALFALALHIQDATEDDLLQHVGEEMITTEGSLLLWRLVNDGGLKGTFVITEEWIEGLEFG